MPHCILEYSANVPDNVDFRGFFKDLHTRLVDTGEIRLDQIKSRWVCHENYVVGDGSSRSGFVYLHVSMLSGRSEVLRCAVADSALELLRQYFPLAQLQLNCSITVEIREISRDTHRKLEKMGVAGSEIS